MRADPTLQCTPGRQSCIVLKPGLKTKNIQASLNYPVCVLFPVAQQPTRGILFRRGKLYFTKRIGCSGRVLRLVLIRVGYDVVISGGCSRLLVPP